MNHKYFTIAVILAFAIQLSTIHCGKEEPEQNPSIDFAAPQQDTLYNDTSTTIILEANAYNQGLKSIELWINGRLVKTFDSPPFQYEWDVSQFQNGDLVTLEAVIADNHGHTAKAKKGIYIKDYRSIYLGNYNFQVIKTNWSIANPTTYDTSYFTGKVTNFKSGDSDINLYPYDNDLNENVQKKITIEFLQNVFITSLLNKDGRLILKTGNHYSHFGGFVGSDYISFGVYGFGGLGGGWNFDITGKKVQ